MSSNRTLTKHHRKPKTNGGTNAERNIVYLRDDLHKAYHLLFGTLPPHQVCKILNELIDPDFRLTCQQRKKKKYGN